MHGKCMIFYMYILLANLNCNIMLSAYWYLSHTHTHTHTHTHRKLYVTLAVMICLTIGGMLLFFLYPRTITIISNMPILTPSYIYVNETEHVLFMSITVSYHHCYHCYHNYYITLLSQSLSNTICYQS